MEHDSEYRARRKAARVSGMPLEAYIARRPVAEIVVFHHLQKTAGSSLRTLIYENYCDHCEFTVEDLPRQGDHGRLYRDWWAGQQNVRAVASHTAGFLLPLVEDAVSLTIVREPVDRVLSLYHFQSGKPTSLADAAEARPDRYHNYQSSALLAPWCDVSELRGPPVNEVTWRGRLERVVGRYLLGTTDRMEETVTRFAERCGWKVPAIPQQKANRDRPHVEDVDRSTRETIERANWLDLELYELASAAVPRYV